MKKGIPLESRDVYITLPQNYDHLSARTKPFIQIPQGEPGRIVTDFEFYDPETNKKIKVNFKPPYELRVKFKKKDEDRAENAKKPLELWYDSGSGWTKFTGVDMISEGKKKGGIGVVDITDWDPMVGWFP